MERLVRLDYLVNQGLFKDTSADGELRVGEYVGWGNDLIRTQPLDCPVGSTSAACPGTPGAGPGGYTYGDFGQIIGGPEVHADGEIWGETAVGPAQRRSAPRLTESLVTRAMELSPANPSFLDERNSILEADLVVNGGNQKKIWQVFAAPRHGLVRRLGRRRRHRPGRGLLDAAGGEHAQGHPHRHVTDQDTGAPVAGAVVAFGGHTSGFAGDYAAMTDATGDYTITGIFPGTYPKVFSRGAGYDPVVQTVSVASRTNTLNWTLRRDWAASAGGGTVVDFTAAGLHRRSAVGPPS